MKLLKITLTVLLFIVLSISNAIFYIYQIPKITITPIEKEIWFDKFYKMEVGGGREPNVPRIINYKGILEWNKGELYFEKNFGHQIYKYIGSNIYSGNAPYQYMQSEAVLKEYWNDWNTSQTVWIMEDPSGKIIKINPYYYYIDDNAEKKKLDGLEEASELALKYVDELIGSSMPGIRDGCSEYRIEIEREYPSESGLKLYERYYFEVVKYIEGNPTYEKIELGIDDYGRLVYIQTLYSAPLCQKDIPDISTDEIKDNLIAAINDRYKSTEYSEIVDIDVGDPRLYKTFQGVRGYVCDAAITFENGDVEKINSKTRLEKAEFSTRYPLAAAIAVEAVLVVASTISIIVTCKKSKKQPSE